MRTASIGLGTGVRSGLPGCSHHFDVHGVLNVVTNDLPLLARTFVRAANALRLPIRPVDEVAVLFRRTNRDGGETGGGRRGWRDIIRWKTLTFTDRTYTHLKKRIRPSEVIIDLRRPASLATLLGEGGLAGEMNSLV